MSHSQLANRVGDLRQLASVRRVVLDDGPEAGVRALQFSTGGGLDFLVLADRSLDIGTVHWRGLPLAWQSPAGFAAPGLISAECEGGQGFNRGFSGFLVTCGLDTIRQPTNGHPLHGRLPYSPARLLNYGETWDEAEPRLFCQGEIIQSRYGGEMLRLVRRIEAPVGGNAIRIIDRVDNLGATAQSQALLYHVNLGYPAIDSGTTVTMNGLELMAPLGSEANSSPEARCFAAPNQQTAICTIRTPTSNGDNFEVAFAFGTASLPHLQVFSDPRPRAGILAIEPCTSARREDGTSEQEPVLAPGASRHYRVDITLSGTPDPIDWSLGSTE